MKNFLSLLFFAIILSSCGSDDDSTPQLQSNSIQELLESYDLWYVEPDQFSSDFNLGQDAITFSFLNNQLYANKNLVGFNPEIIGEQETSYSVEQTENTANVTINDTEFKVIGISGNSLKLVDDDNTAFYITGYNASEFPSLDIIYFERMAHLFNEYKFWQKTETENPDEIDGEFSSINHIEFSAIRNFKSSEDAEGLTYDEINWQYQGSYKLTKMEDDDGNISNELIFVYLDENNRENDTLKVRVINENKIQLSESESGIHYLFEGNTNTPF
ncbi:hypothetical protein [Mesonia aestuariivivens]|uniref:Lipocalin-like domain-containing protein n=1 Tax=Mesonia aestuariivivens TaxID=2796128 RepID=A0ABS6W619_9FLAO|nr:hypothetical protein [Mesonia aestuariivivens]MBW2962987.1 hypothetical protein [Mesonia aestuariivivens]